MRACFGAFAGGIAGGLKLRHDHGSRFVADDYQRQLAFLGIESSPAFVRAPEGNGSVERCSTGRHPKPFTETAATGAVCLLPLRDPKPDPTISRRAAKVARHS